jgi:hypothetical protein
MELMLIAIPLYVHRGVPVYSTIRCDRTPFGMIDGLVHCSRLYRDENDTEDKEYFGYVGESLPLHGIELLTCVRGQSLIPKILVKVSSPNIRSRVGEHQCLQILLRIVDTTDI